MNDIIYLHLEGREGLIDPRMLIRAIENFMGLLHEVDATISKRSSGYCEWYVGPVTRKSPLNIGFVGQAPMDKQPHLKRVHRECATGIRTLTDKGDRPPSYSDAAIQKVKHLGELEFLPHKTGLTLIKVHHQKKEVRLVNATYEHVQEFTTPRYEAEGSVIGNLDSITVHKGNEFRVWDELTQRAVTCRFKKEMLEQAKDLLGKRVLVAGLVNVSSKGDKLSVDVAELDSYPDEKDLPTIEDMSGLVDDFTGGMSIKEYLQG